MKNYTKLFLIFITTYFVCSFQPKANSNAKKECYTPIKFKDLTLNGELFERAIKNFDRLEEEKYQPQNVFLTNEQSMFWPGDTEGRTMLALVLNAQVTKRSPKYLEEIIKKYPQKMNNKGYFGNIYSDSSKISEQQLSSHGWVLRGLCEYYLWKKDTSVLAMIDKIINNLVLPTAGFHSKYPIDPTQRKDGGSHSGTQQGTIGEWILSTDIGCDHILLDGIIQAYQIRPSEKLKAIIDEMITIFLKIDQLKIKAQTHATLTAMRGLLRWYEVTNNQKLLNIVISKWELYKKEGMSENFENFNWFGRPEWTEPCAVVDSYMIAVYLWKFTEKAAYLEDAHQIYYNGLGVEQRANGGFGIQNCSGAKNNPHVEATLQEAHWCCTMRGGEGLSRAAEFTYFTKNNYEIAIPFYQNSIANFNFKNQKLKLEQTTNYPFATTTKIKVLKSEIKNNVLLKLFIPSWFINPIITKNGKKYNAVYKDGFAYIYTTLSENTVLELSGKMKLSTKEVHNNNSISNGYSFMYGPLLLGYQGNEVINLNKNIEIVNSNNSVFKVKGQDVNLMPIFHIMNPDVSVDKKYKRQIVFKGN